MEVIPVVYTLKYVILAKYNSCDQTCILSGQTTSGECCGRAQASQLLWRCQGLPRTHLLTLDCFRHHSSTPNDLFRCLLLLCLYISRYKGEMDCPVHFILYIWVLSSYTASIIHASSRESWQKVHEKLVLYFNWVVQKSSFSLPSGKVWAIHHSCLNLRGCLSLHHTAVMSDLTGGLHCTALLSCSELTVLHGENGRRGLLRFSLIIPCFFGWTCSNYFQYLP